MEILTHGDGSHMGKEVKELQEMYVAMNGGA